jgi:hypothetical protein
MEFCLILVCIFIPQIYKSGIKIPDFRQNFLKKVFVFMHTTKSLKEKITSYFHTTKKTSKKNVLACILALITSLLKSRELDQYFKKIKNKYFFLLNIKDYEFIRKTYSRY